MTDRHHGYVVTLAADLRADDAEPVITALRQIRGVVAVEPIVADTMTHVALARARTDLGTRVLSALTRELEADR